MYDNDVLIHDVEKCCEEVQDSTCCKMQQNLLDCCMTNPFRIAKTYSKSFDIDHLKNGFEDGGGEDLGACEYFDLSNTTNIIIG